MPTFVHTFPRHHNRFIALLLAALIPLTISACGSTNATTQNNMSVNAPSNAFWVANGTNVLEFYPYAGGNTGAPILTLNSNAFTAPQGVVFDSANNLWVIDGGGNGVHPALFKFTEAQLRSALTTSSLSPNVTISSSLFAFPQQAVFDKAGSLWVSDNGANVIYALTSAQLAASNANITPNATLLSNPAFDGPLGLTFDGNGALWVANNASTTIYRFDASQLAPMSAGGQTTSAPAVVLADQGGTIRAPWGLVFDTAGKLWWSNSDPNSAYTVVAYAANLLQTSGSPAATVTLSPATDQGETTLAAPNGIAFDSQGNLGVVSSLAPNGLAFYSATQTKASGAAVPAVFVPGTRSTVDMAAGCNSGPLIH